MLHEIHLVLDKLDVEVLSSFLFFVFFLVGLSDELSDPERGLVSTLQFLDESTDRFPVFLEADEPFLIRVVIRLEFN